jgi:hypothetical protein
VYFITSLLIKIPVTSKKMYIWICIQINWMKGTPEPCWANGQANKPTQPTGCKGATKFACNLTQDHNFHLVNAYFSQVAICQTVVFLYSVIIPVMTLHGAWQWQSLALQLHCCFAVPTVCSPPINFLSYWIGDPLEHFHVVTSSSTAYLNNTGQLFGQCSHTYIITGRCM